MVIDFLRIVSLIFLIFITLIDIPLYNKLKDPQFQFIIAFIILIILLLVDVGVGFILSLIMFIIYLKIYNKFLFNKKSVNEVDNVNNINNKDQISNITKLNYISPEILLSAQNNIVDINSYNTEVKGINKGLNNENVYGAQGLDIDKNDFMGFEKNKYQLF